MTQSLQKFSVDDDCSTFFRENGYLALRDVFTVDQIREISEDICGVFSILMNKNGIASRDLVLEAYNNDVDLWMVGARQLQNSLSLFRAAGQPKIIALLKKLGLRDPMNWVHPEGRIDIPGNLKYLQPWHQDWRSGQGSLNSVTMWIPLHDVGKDDGAIELAAGSHLWGLLPIEELANPRRYSIVDGRLDRFPPLVTTLKAGECVIFSQMLAHRSGINSSELPRMTVQLRYSDRSESHFVDNRYRTPKESELVWEHTPTAQDMRRVYTIAS